MTSREVEIGLIADSDIEKANVFYNSIYGTTRDKPKFNWEFRSGPAMEGIYVVAKDKATGMIVGSQAAIPITIILSSGRKVLTAKSEDTLVHPEYRGLAIFEKMYALLFEECERKKIQYIWGFTYAIKPFSKLGFDCPFGVSESLLVFDILSSANYLAKHNRSKTRWTTMKMLGLSILSRVKSLGVLVPSRLAGITCAVVDRTALTENTSLIDAILAVAPDTFIVNQDTDYLRWRIGENPYHEEVLVLNFYMESRHVANIVFNHHTGGVWYVIQDLYSPLLKAAQREAVLREAIKSLKTKARHKPVMIRSWEFDQNAASLEALSNRKRAGFWHIHHGAVFVWKGLANSEFLDPRNFILSRINSEGKI